ncbi:MULTISPECIES: large conductance mechanosensitive channel protein MscL [unclassified Streptomyces]|uniref:large conductance mechanosensitive channel protein MscL n=1 Tax=unclassified Streptomyces TaxID=2593676 RepID=UPI002DD825DC|nr:MULTISPECIES: large conductance mechanosensitive channel protein MscL [unclassified Streptomyces]WSA78425.1 large conductance mechanosensitive channel protein MscL [Streptomyces sp. NBC_01799]WSF85110.1 large conductance mechanosensitive channel protein MscL [Streptomyces sp. NBC_01744]WSA69937.1 large conductance mechanosensitive channel protein MscL [Streptomyces sp. NBC_01800]WSC38599.1 large conductance mechanosensitive channel protein MscL [Streptomyces sp. NBC_01763]WSC46736.1 large c
MLNGFKDFILRGNVISMAIGLAVGAAFTAVVTGFSTAFITPLIGLATGSVGDFSNARFTVEGAEFPYGKFLAAAIAFLITAAVLYFCVVVPMTKVQNRFASSKDQKVDIKAALRDCPRCYTEIPAIASRCAHCTSEVKPDPEALALAELPAQR